MLRAPATADAAQAAQPWRIAGERIALHVRVTPRAGRDAIDRIETRADGRAVLKVRLAAPPADGEANEALRRLIAGTLDISSRDVVIASGASSRIKTLHLPLAAMRGLERLAAGGGA